jgi:hypothetical protein
VPAQVALQSPLDGAKLADTAVTLVWSKSTPLITRYWVQVGTDTSFTFSTVDSSVTDTTYRPHGLQPKQTYYWRVKAYNAGGWGPFSILRNFTCGPTSVAEDRAMPTTYALHQNYPNPFNPSTQIEFALPKQDHVRLEVFNLLGERVAILVDDMETAGYHSVRFDASKLASGIYLYRLTSGESTFTKKMVLTK